MGQVQQRRDNAANYSRDRDYVVISNSSGGPNIQVDSYHISEYCDNVYTGGEYAGIVLWSKDGQSHWDCRGIACHAGYIFICNSDGLANQFPGEPGQVHGAAYRKLFGETMSGICGSGFAIQRGEIKFNSFSMNARSDAYHNNEKAMNADEQFDITHLLREWFQRGQPNGTEWDINDFHGIGYRHPLTPRIDSRTHESWSNLQPSHSGTQTGGSFGAGGCYYSDAELQKRAQKPCKYGLNCPYLKRGNCQFFHGPGCSSQGYPATNAVPKKFPITVKCPHCRKPNVWSNGDYQEGWPYTCAYAGCRKTFQTVTCPHCSRTNEWSNANYMEGFVVTCAHAGCRKDFQTLTCPHCSRTNYDETADIREGLVYTCAHDGCRKDFQFVICPHCDGMNYSSYCDIFPGSVYTCVHAGCRKNFQK